VRDIVLPASNRDEISALMYSISTAAGYHPALARTIRCRRILSFGPRPAFRERL